MIFPEHMEFRYYITPERKECFALYDKTLGSRMTYLNQTQDLGQCLIDLYDMDFYDAYCALAEINKLVSSLSTDHAITDTWEKLLELSLPLCEVHPFFGLLAKELSELESAYAHGQDADAALVLSFANDFEAIVSDAKALIERCLDDRSAGLLHGREIPRGALRCVAPLRRYEVRRACHRGGHAGRSGV